VCKKRKYEFFMGFWKFVEKKLKSKKVGKLILINKSLFNKFPKFMQVWAYESRKGMHSFFKEFDTL
jgi:hypothetical protein